MHSWPATLGCFLSGVLIDTDHYLDYYLLHKKFPYRYKDLVNFCFDKRVKKNYLFFHAYEYLFVLCFFKLILGAEGQKVKIRFNRVGELIANKMRC